MHLSDQKLNKIIKIMVVITLTLGSLYLLSQFSGFLDSIKGAISAVLTPFLIAFFVNFLIYPLVIYAEQKGIRPRWLIVTIIYAIIFGILGLIVYKMTPYVVQQLLDLITIKIPDIIKDLKQQIDNLHLSEDFMNMFTDTQNGMMGSLKNILLNATTSVPGIISSIFTVVLTPIILFYFLKDHNQIGEGIYRVVPVKYKEHFIELTKRINETLGLYIRGQFIIMFGIAVISTLGYILIGLDYAIVFGIIVGLTNIIPYIGATIAAIVPVTYSILTNDVPWYYILLLNFGFQFVEGNILQPVIMSKQLDMHPLIILAAILGFGSLLGVLGVILAVPIAGVIKVCILYYREVKHKEDEKRGYEV